MRFNQQHSMLRYLFSLLIVITSLTFYAAKAETISERTQNPEAAKFYIPDANLRIALKTNYPYLFSGDSVLLEFAQSLQQLDIAHTGVVDFTGVEHFTGLFVLTITGDNASTLPSLSYFPQLQSFMCEDCGISQLPDFSGNPNLEAISANNNTIGTFPDLSNNPLIRSIELQHNDLTEVPDLSAFPYLELLIVSYNPITSFPDLSVNTELKRLWLRATQIGELPDLSMLTHLQDLDIQECSLTIFPTLNALGLVWCDASHNSFRDLSSLSNTNIGADGSFFSVAYNRLTFEDLLPIASMGSAQVLYNEQGYATDDVQLVASLNSSYTIHLGVDELVTTNRYVWLKNGIVIDTTEVNQLVLSSITSDDAGEYVALISNPALPGIVIQSGTINLTLTSSEYFYIPDDNFRMELMSAYPSAFTGNLLILSEAASVEVISCNSPICNFDGIQFFGNLTKLGYAENTAGGVPDLTQLPLLDWLNIRQSAINGPLNLTQNPKLATLLITDSGLQSFPDITANPLLWQIDLLGNNISDVPNLSTMKNIRDINVAVNALTQFPVFNDSVEYIWLHYNKISEVPDIFYLKNLKVLSVGANFLTQLPSLNNPRLSELHVDLNELTELPDFSNTMIGASGSLLSVEQNRLTFEDLLPLMGKPFESFKYGNQKNFSDSSTVSVPMDQAFNISLGIDNTITTNVYNWYKDGVLIATGNVNTFGIPAVSKSDAGEYYVTVTNPAVPNLTLRSGTTTLQVMDTVSAQYFYIPDDNFRNDMMSQYPTAFKGDSLNVSAASSIESIKCDGPINDFNGIQFFGSLRNFEEVDNTAGTLPDLSLFPHLESLSIYHCTLNGTVDLSNNPKLLTLIIEASGLDAFPDVSHNLNLYFISMMENNISTLPDLSVFTKLKEINMAQNSLTEVPMFNDSIESVLLMDNKLSQLPDLSYLKNLTKLGLSGNLLTALPSFNNPSLNTLLLNENMLTSLPDFSNTLIGTPGSQLFLNNNSLTFEDLLPFVGKPFDTFQYLGQKSPITNDGTLSIQQSHQFKISLGIDSAVTTNVYNWYKENVLVASGNMNEFVIPAVAQTDAGVYQAIVTNPDLPDLTLTSGLTTLIVNDSLYWIADANLRNCLKSSYPSIFNSEDYVIGSLAKTVTSIECASLGIQNLSGMEAFVNANLILLSNNAITTFPDLGTFPNLEMLIANGNKLHEFPSLENNEKIRVIYLMYNEITSLPDLSHLTLLEGLAIGYNPISSLPSLSANTGLKMLAIQSTQLTNFPDLSANLNLEDLQMGWNPQFNTWPTLAANVNLQSIGCQHNGLQQIPDLSIYPGLRSLSCGDNNLSQLPDLSVLHELNYLDAQNNELSALPNLSQTKLGEEFSQLYVQGNHLTFEDLIPIATLPGYAVLKYSPQSIPDVQSLLAVTEDESFAIDIGFDKDISNNSYRWYKDSVTVTTTPTGVLYVESASASDAGYYHCIITNSLLPDLSLKWRSATVTVQAAQDDCTNVLNFDDFKVQITSASCVSGGKILIKEKGSPAMSIKEYTLENVFTGQKNITTYPEIVELAEGEYKLYLTKGECVFEWPELLQIRKDQNCHHPVISPNNDGLSEDYYIPFQGQVKIYNRDGVIINQFPAPGSWNGTDSYGNVVPMGLYIIACDGQKEISITVVR